MPTHASHTGQSQRRQRSPGRLLITLLRHHAHKYGADSAGRLTLDQIHKYLGLESLTEEQLHQIVTTCDKQRFVLEDGPTLLVRAAQGHSFQVDESATGMKELTLDTPDLPERTLHGTFEGAVEPIQETGLSRMGRQHIHFTHNVPESGEVVSGMRRSCTHIVEIDLRAALRDGYKFYRSANGVILTPGGEDGFLPPKYIIGITER